MYLTCVSLTTRSYKTLLRRKVNIHASLHVGQYFVFAYYGDFYLGPSHTERYQSIRCSTKIKFRQIIFV